MRLILTSNLQNPHESIIQAQAGRGRALILDRLCYYLTNNPRRLLASCYQNVSVCPGLLATKRTAESTRSSKKQPHEREHEQSVVLSSRVTKLKIIRRRRRRLLLHSRIDSIRFDSIHALHAGHVLEKWRWPLCSPPYKKRACTAVGGHHN